MTAFTLHASQHVPRPVDETFAFFEKAENLARLTPDNLAFQLRTGERLMRRGLVVEYRIKPLFGIPVGWTSVIDEYIPNERFTDTQLRGPYRRWRHVHSFHMEDGGTRVEDEVTYELPLGPLGRLLNRLLIRPRLEQIFGYRAAAIDRLLPPRQATTQALTVAVAGGSGFVGGGIAGELARRGHRVIVLSHRPEHAGDNLPDGVEIREADVTQSEGLTDALAGADVLVIALAFPNLPMEDRSKGWTFEAIDAEGTERLTQAAMQAGIRRLLYISGAGAAPDAERHWFRAKWRAEEAIRSSGIDYTIVRPTWIFGPRDVALNRFLGFARSLPFVPMTNFGQQRMAPVFVGDVARLVADALVDEAARHQVFEIGGPETMRMRDVIRRTLAVARLRRPLIPAPPALVKLAASVLQFVPGRPLTPEAVDFINQPAETDTRPLLDRMPRRLTTLEEGLRTYLLPRSF